MGKKVLVTGSSGFVGTYFVRNNNDFTIIEVDLLTDKVENVNFSGVDSVLHLAALVHQMSGAPEEEYFRVNRDLAYQVAIRAKEMGVKQFVLMSTAKVYGESADSNPCWDEHSQCIPVDPYGKSKYEAEKLIGDLGDSEFRVAIVRSPVVYGPGVRANMFNLVKLVDKVPVLPFGNTDNRRSIVYIGNLVALLKHIIATDAAGVFIAGDLSPVSTTDLVKLIGKHLEKKIFLFGIPGWLLKSAHKLKPAFYNRLFGSLVLDNKGTNKRLYFHPSFTTAEGIHDMVEWYKTLAHKD